MKVLFFLIVLVSGGCAASHPAAVLESGPKIAINRSMVTARDCLP